jgi:hypothetical protein
MKPQASVRRAGEHAVEHEGVHVDARHRFSGAAAR